MTENNKPRFTKANDEVDLMLLLAKGIYIIKKYIVLIVVFTGLGILAGWGTYYLIPPTYNSRMIADSGILPNTELINIVESWQFLLKKKDYQTLAQVLKLSPDITRKIKSIEAENTTTANTNRLVPEENEQHTFTVRIQVSDNTILDSLEYAFINFWENNKYVQQRSELKKEQLQRLRLKIIHEIADLDSLKMAVKSILRSDISVSNKALLADPSDLNIETINLYEKLLNVETLLKFVEDIQVVESFNKSSKPDEPKLGRSMSIGASAGFILACLIIAVLILRKQIEKVNLLHAEV